MRYASVLGALFTVVSPMLAGCGAAAPDDVSSSSAHLDQSTASLIFSANGSYGASAPLTAGETITVSYDTGRAPSSGCVQTQNGRPVYATIGYEQLNNGPVTSFFAAGNDADPTATPTFTIPAGQGGDLAVWFETTSIAGCHVWDSNYGGNFHFNVAASANAPQWVGNADAVVSRATCGNAACDADRHPLADSGDSFTYDTWARQRAAVTELELQVYKSGVTDHDNADLWKELDVEVHWRVGGVGPYTMSYVSFEDRVGNNARYSFGLRNIDPLQGINGSALSNASQCPSFTLVTSADGQYVSATMDFWFTVNGVELRPSNGQTFTGTFANYLGLYQVCVPQGAATR